MVGLHLVLGNKFNQRTELCRNSISVSSASSFTCVLHCSLAQIGFFSTVLMVKNKITTAQRFSFFFLFIGHSLRHLTLQIPHPNILQKSHISQVCTGCLTTNQLNRLLCLTLFKTVLKTINYTLGIASYCDTAVLPAVF